MEEEDVIALSRVTRVLYMALLVFQDDPNRWTTQAYAKDARREVVWRGSPQAVCWCMAGALYKAADILDDDPKWVTWQEVALEAGVAVAHKYGYDSISHLNDDRAMTFSHLTKMVVEAVREGLAVAGVVDQLPQEEVQQVVNYLDWLDKVHEGDESYAILPKPVEGKIGMAKQEWEEFLAWRKEKGKWLE